MECEGWSCGEWKCDTHTHTHTHTQEFMCSEGIELNPSEERPTDPYTESRRQPQHTYTTPSIYDKLRQFLELDRHVLMFSCVWDDRDNMFGEMRPYVSLNHVAILVHAYEQTQGCHTTYLPSPPPSSLTHTHTRTCTHRSSTTIW